MDKVLLTSADLMALLHISEATLWRKVKRGEIPVPQTICGLKRWPREQFAAFLPENVKPVPRDRKRMKVAA